MLCDCFRRTRIRSYLIASCHGGGGAVSGQTPAAAGGGGFAAAKNPPAHPPRYPVADVDDKLCCIVLRRDFNAQRYYCIVLCDLHIYNVSHTMVFCRITTEHYYYYCHYYIQVKCGRLRSPRSYNYHVVYLLPVPNAVRRAVNLLVTTVCCSWLRL